MAERSRILEQSHSLRPRHPPPRILHHFRRHRRNYLSEQPLHGDAHKKNVLKTANGLVWTDFEDACFGPVPERDLACFVRTSLEPAGFALASYGDYMDPARLKPFFAARDLQGAAWGAILSTRFPDRKERTADGWPLPAPDMARPLAFANETRVAESILPARFLPHLPHRSSVSSSSW